jgi:hypothetical protein
MTTMVKGRMRGLAILAAGLVTAACGSKPPETKQPAGPTAMAPAAAHGTASPDVSEGGALKYTPPPDWTAEKPSSSMRQGQYRLARAVGDAEDGELAVFYFQGSGGGVQANIDRWIGQFSKPDGSPATEAATMTKREVNGMKVSVVDVSGTYHAAMGPMLAETQTKPGFRMLAAVVETKGGPWFFKFTGPAKTVARWEKSFSAFLETCRQ